MNEQKDLPCVEKLTFDTLDKAKAEAVVIKWRHGTELQAYKCEHCGLWHLSSG